ncbi:MAG: hypothetical protein ABH851_03115 [Methanobacteriota archaeon]
MKTKRKEYDLLAQVERMIESDGYKNAEKTMLEFGQRVGKCRNDEQRRVVWQELAQFEDSLKDGRMVQPEDFEVEFTTLRRALQEDI